MRNKPALAAAIAALTVALFALRPDDTRAQPAAAKPQAPPPVPVEVAAATTSEIAAVQWVPGTVMARDDARIASELAGRVVALAEVGDRIGKGDTIAKLDDEALRLQVGENQAALARIDAQLEFQTRQLARLATLKSQSSIAETQLDEAQSQREMLVHDRDRAAVALEESRRRLREATVRAPFAGIVAERSTQLGEFLQPGATVVRLVNTERLEVRAQAPVSLGATLRAGDAVTLRGGARAELEKIRAVVPVGDAQSRQLEVRIAVADGSWAIGSAVEVALPSGATQSVVAIPRDALVLRGRETFVFKVDGEDKAERVTVETGAAAGELIEVKGSVTAGDRLVVRGAERLQPGQTLLIRSAAAAPAAVARSSR